MGWLFFDGGLIAAGYVASIYTWPWIRTNVINGLPVEVAKLRAMADALEAKIKPKV